MINYMEITDLLNKEVIAERKDELSNYYNMVHELINKEVIQTDEEIEQKRRQDLSKSPVLATEYERGFRWGLIKALEILGNCFDKSYKKLEESL